MDSQIDNSTSSGNPLNIIAGNLATAERIQEIKKALDEREMENAPIEAVTGYTGGRQSYESANEAQKRLVDIAVNPPGPVQDTVGLCAGYVNDVFGYAGIVPAGTICCAHGSMMEAGTLSHDFDNIPVGACVFSNQSNPHVDCNLGHDAGHIGIYIGDGMVRENAGSYPGIQSGVHNIPLDQWLDAWQLGGNDVAWGWLGGIDLSKQ